MSSKTIVRDGQDLTIQEMSRRSGLSEHTLRYYERIGLITPIPRDDSSGHRRYPVETVGRVESLACLRGTGLSISEIRRYLVLLEQGASGAAEQRALFAAHEEMIANEIALMEKRRKYLAGKAAYWGAIESGDLDAAKEIGEANHRIAKMLTRKRDEL